MSLHRNLYSNDQSCHIYSLDFNFFDYGIIEIENITGTYRWKYVSMMREDMYKNIIWVENDWMFQNHPHLSKD